MKKWLSFLSSIVLVLVLAACGGGDDEAGDTNAKKLVIGASPTPHAEILEHVKPILKEKGIDLEIKEYNDYVLPNEGLDSKELDANYFQHIPYLETEIAQKGYKFVNAGGVHIEPMGIYSKKYKSIDDIPDGAKVVYSSSTSDHGRVLALLEKEGLIKLKDGVDKVNATLADIVENPKNLKLEDPSKSPAPEMLIPSYNNDEGDIFVINSNFAIDGGLNPLKDSIAIESGEDNPYVNIIAVRSEDKDKEEIKTLLDVLHSKEVQDWITEHYDGSIIPVSK